MKNYICKKCGTSDSKLMKCDCGGKIVEVSFQEWDALKHAYHLVGYKNPLKNNK